MSQPPSSFFPSPQSSSLVQDSQTSSTFQGRSSLKSKTKRSTKPNHSSSSPVASHDITREWRDTDKASLPLAPPASNHNNNTPPPALQSQHAASLRHGTSTSNSGGKVVWRKILYEKQPFEDNYVDPLLFLNELRRNSNVTQYKCSDVVMDSIAIAQNISIVIQFILMVSHVLSDNIRAPTLLCLDCSIFLLALLMFACYSSEGKKSWEILRQTTRQVVSIGPMLLLMSPLLSNLTVSYSNDTIMAMSIIMMTVHVLVTDYRYLNGYTISCEQSFAMNSAMFGVVLMVSRIPRGFDGVALLTFGAICFSLSPMARHSMRRASFTFHATFSALLCGIIIVQLLFLPFIFLLVYVLMLVLLCLCIPWCFVRFHESWKVQINGPWDEAKPTNSAAAAEWANSGLLS